MSFEFDVLSITTAIDVPAARTACAGALRALQTLAASLGVVGTVYALRAVQGCIKWVRLYRSKEPCRGTAEHALGDLAIALGKLFGV